MATHDKRWSWGEWIRQRARAVGIMRNVDLAAEIGCTPSHLTRWLRSPVPPPHMRRGLDLALARALRVAPPVLFGAYATTDPNAVDAGEDPNAVDRMRTEIVSAVELLDGPRLRALRTLLVGAA